MTTRALSEVLTRLASRRRFGVQLGLDRMVRVLSRLGDPHQYFRSVHVAGTNGKGSTAAMIEAALQAGNYRVGLYTSPHLSRVTERVRVNEREIPEAELAATLDQVLGLDAELTFFETLTAVALTYFARAGVEVAVVETGLGGRLDATNVLRPVTSVITSIALDHTEVLGPDLASIAAEKAGIVKPGVPVVVAAGDPAAIGVVQRKAAEVGSHMLLQRRDFRCGRDAAGLTYHGASGSVGPLRLGLAGPHQEDNAAVALATLECLEAVEIKTSVDSRLRGLERVRWPGRMEWIGNCLFDCAHNPAAARALVSALPEDVKFCLVFGALRDKDAKHTLEVLRPRVRRTVLTAVPTERAMSVQELQQLAPTAETAADPAVAQQLIAEDSGPILVTGSSYIVGDLRARLLGEASTREHLSDPGPV